MKTYTLVNTTDGDGGETRTVKVDTLDGARIRLMRWLSKSEYDSDGEGDVEVTGDVQDKTGAVVASIVVTFEDNEDSDEPMVMSGWRTA